MLQRLFGPDMLPGNPEGAAAIDQALAVAESRMMLFEFAEYGSLQSLLKKVSLPVRTADDPREYLPTCTARPSACVLFFDAFYSSMFLVGSGYH